MFKKLTEELNKFMEGSINELSNDTVRQTRDKRLSNMRDARADYLAGKSSLHSFKNQQDKAKRNAELVQKRSDRFNSKATISAYFPRTTASDLWLVPETKITEEEAIKYTNACIACEDADSFDIVTTIEEAKKYWEDKKEAQCYYTQGLATLVDTELPGRTVSTLDNARIFIDLNGMVAKHKKELSVGVAIVDLFRNVYFHNVDKCKSQKSCPEGYVLVDITCELDLQETIIDDSIRDIIKDIPTLKQYVNSEIVLNRIEWELDDLDQENGRIDLNFTTVTTAEQVASQLVAKNNRVGNNNAIMIDLVAKVEQEEWERFVEEYM